MLLIIVTQASLEVCKLHNQLSGILLQNETHLISRWHSAIEPARVALGAPLLVKDVNESEIGGASRRVRVNCQQWYVGMEVWEWGVWE